MAVAAREPHRRAAVAHRSIHVCAHLKEQFDDAGVPVVRGAVQRCRARQSGRVHDSPRPEEQLGEVVVADATDDVKRRQAVVRQQGGRLDGRLAKRSANCCNTTLSSAARATYAPRPGGSSESLSNIVELARSTEFNADDAYVALRQLCAPCGRALRAERRRQRHQIHTGQKKDIRSHVHTLGT